MPNGDNVPQQEQAEPEGINIFAPEMLEEVTIKLTRGQATFIYGFLAQNIQPRGFAMVEFAYDMQNRLDAALDITRNVKVEIVEAAEETSTIVTTPIKGPTFIGDPPKDMSKLQPVFDNVSISTNETKEE
jgi:hypothetical protein